ncbi:hypothetical protein P7K49_036803 [Saguinus oedipus]|uniref:Uncharacterized protein n=1 Tax=Saguinus oedipus TaxID=9490 RepID=A0ABQ9TL60_SAGOE|nr:hypothetical protein P7K49_036803 [Saguinus oedipus]
MPGFHDGSQKANSHRHSKLPNSKEAKRRKLSTGFCHADLMPIPAVNVNRHHVVQVVSNDPAVQKQPMLTNASDKPGHKCHLTPQEVL